MACVRLAGRMYIYARGCESIRVSSQDAMCRKRESTGHDSRKTHRGLLLLRSIFLVLLQRSASLHTYKYRNITTTTTTTTTTRTTCVRWTTVSRSTPADTTSSDDPVLFSIRGTASPCTRLCPIDNY